MNNLKFLYGLMILTAIYQLSFLFNYVTDNLGDFHMISVDFYWISSGLIGIVIGACIAIKGKVNLFGKIFALSLAWFGINLLVLWLFTFWITSM